MSKPVPEPVEGWTFRRSQTGRLRATIDGWAAEIIEGELWSQTATPLAVVRALLADAAPLTVGAALATAEVQSGECVVEFAEVYEDGAVWWQARAETSDDEPVFRDRMWYPHPLADGRVPPKWLSWKTWHRTLVVDYLRPCRLVPLADADRDPAERGTL